MSKDMELNILSKYRSHLMGIAILFILFTHNSMNLSGSFGRINNCLKMLSQSGVDIFFFLSGFGCFYSLSTKSAKEFWQKRLVKILIPYLVVIAVYGVIRIGICADEMAIYLSKYVFITFFIKGELAEWFIAAILVTYIFAPFIYKIMNNKLSFSLYLLGLLYFIIIISRVFLHNSPVYYRMVEIWFTRLPAFLVGMIVGKLSIEKNISITSKKAIYIIGMSIASMIILIINYYMKISSYWLINRLLFLPFMFGIILLYIKLLEYSKNAYIGKILKWIGTITLELYLVHEKILSICDSVLRHFNYNKMIGSIVSNVMAVFLSIAVAKIVQIIVVQCERIVMRRNNKYVKRPV